MLLARFIAVVLAGTASPALAQSMPMNMPGMATPAHPKAKAKPVKKAKETPVSVSHARHPTNATSSHAEHRPMALPVSAPPQPATPAPIDHSHMDRRATAIPMPGEGATATPVEPLGMGAMQMSHSAEDHGGMTMAGALGPYAMQRESSGTAWQPDNSQVMGLMTHKGDWMLMAHGILNLVYDHQDGRRGDDKAFGSGMLMGMAQRPLGNGKVQFKAMVSPDPLMGARGYPLLLASGETANGRDRLIDTQHPHDFFMELSASASQNIGAKSSVFIYGGLPAEPAFGPPAFMHREAILDSPEAPISHHWLDSTHISFGVLTAGLVVDRMKVELSRFNGREPDQHRWNIETGPLDSTAVRVSWNPTRTLALQGSWGHLTDPEQLEPGVDQKRWSASAMWADEVAPGWKAAATLAWGRKSALGHSDDALAAEASFKHAQWTLFGRGEITGNRELVQGQDEPAYRVCKASIGALRDFRIADHLSVGAGGLLSLNFVPAPLAPLYGGSNPAGAMAFVRIKLN